MQRLHADWSVESAAALAGGLASPAYPRLQAGWSGDRPALQADWSVVRASLAAAWPVVRAALAGGLVDRSCSACRLVGGACNDFRRTGGRACSGLQPNWSVKPSAIAGGLVSGAFSASRWTGQSSVQRLQADWSAKHAVSRRVWSFSGGLVGLACSACRRTHLPDCACRSRARRLQAVACRRIGSSVQHLQADWSVERAALTGGLVDRACSACRRTGRSNERRLQADW